MDIKIVKFQSHGDQRGQLISLEEEKNLPFKIKRVYYMYNTAKEAIRGKHAHKSLEQVLVCLNGSCKITLDDGHEKETVVLDKPNEGLYINSFLWREIYDFSKDTVLIVLASDYYNEDDYIRNYNEFLNYIGTNNK